MSEATRFRYLIEGPALDVFEADGWFVQLTPFASLYLGPDKPDIAKGDRVRVTIEKVLPPG